MMAHHGDLFGDDDKFYSFIHGWINLNVHLCLIRHFLFIERQKPIRLSVHSEDLTPNHTEFLCLCRNITSLAHFALITTEATRQLRASYYWE